MANPTISRLGIYQFWYKHWYSDNLYATNLQYDKIIVCLVQSYLDYGLNFKSSIFMHEYWYRLKTSKVLRLQPGLTASPNRYFRKLKVKVKRKGGTYEHSVWQRWQTPEYFPLRTWLFKYLNWLIISVHWYKPWKYKKVVKDKNLNSARVIQGVNKQSHISGNLKRIKLILSLLVKYSHSIKDYQF